MTEQLLIRECTPEARACITSYNADERV